MSPLVTLITNATNLAKCSMTSKALVHCYLVCNELWILVCRTGLPVLVAHAKGYGTRAQGDVGEQPMVCAHHMWAPLCRAGVFLYGECIGHVPIDHVPPGRGWSWVWRPAHHMTSSPWLHGVHAHPGNEPLLNECDQSDRVTCGTVSRPDQKLVVRSHLNRFM